MPFLPLTFFTALFRHKVTPYHEQRQQLKSAAVKERLRLAKNPNTNKEILYYLAQHDPEPKVRVAVAKNASTPVHVAKYQAKDQDVDVRLALAARLVDLLPDIGQDQQSQLYAYTVQALGTLALDEVLKVRLALSSAIRDHAFAPPKVALQLAKDAERAVAEPILRYCAGLSDDDLLGILSGHPEEWVVSAIAQRNRVDAKASQMIIDASIDAQAPATGVYLIENDGADIQPSLLYQIVDRAQDFTQWQAPMAMRHALPSDVAKTLAGFVAPSVRDILMLRDDFPAQTRAELAEIFHRRLDYAAEHADDSVSVEVRLRRVIAQGALDEDCLSDALAMRDYDFVAAGMAYLLKVEFITVRKIIEMDAPKAITALTWKAGLSMRFALELQKSVAKVQPKNIIYPKDGSDYPLSEDVMRWKLEFLGLA